MVFQVSIVAMQRGEQLLPFKTRSGDTLEILYLEELSAEVSVGFISICWFKFSFCVSIWVKRISVLSVGGVCEGAPV